MNAGRLALLTLCVLAIAACGRDRTPQLPNLEVATEARASAPSTAVSTSAAREVELLPDTVVRVRLDRALSTNRNAAGDPFEATLDRPVVVNNVEILPKGTKFTGHVTASRTSGRLKGRGVISLTLDAFEARGRRYPIATSLDTRMTAAHKKRNIEMIGGGTGIGALIGGLSGGKKGAGIGAAAGAAAGTGVAAATGEKAVNLPAGTPCRFSLKRSVRVLPE